MALVSVEEQVIVKCSADLRCLQVCGFKANGQTEAKIQRQDVTRCYSGLASDRDVSPDGCYGGASNFGWLCPMHLLPRTRERRGTALQVGNDTRFVLQTCAVCRSAALMQTDKRGQDSGPRCNETQHCLRVLTCRVPSQGIKS